MKVALAAAAALAALPALSAALTTGLLVPLYWDPSSATDCWSSVRSMGSTNPDLPLLVVINPNSGPSDGDADYYSCLPALRASLPKAKIVGYVDTMYDGNGDRTPAEVLADVSVYQGWASGKGSANVKLDGIFFDDVNPLASKLSRYTEFYNAVKSSFGASSTVVLNPGATPDTNSYYSIADVIVSYESPISTYSAADVAAATSASSPGSKQAVMVLSIKQSDLPQLVKDNVGNYAYFFATDLVFGKVDVYGKLPTIWSVEVSQVAAANGLASNKATTTTSIKPQTTTTTKKPTTKKVTTTTKKRSSKKTTKKTTAKAKSSSKKRAAEKTTKKSSKKHTTTKRSSAKKAKASSSAHAKKRAVH